MTSDGRLNFRALAFIVSIARRTEARGAAASWTEPRLFTPYTNYTSRSFYISSIHFAYNLPHLHRDARQHAIVGGVHHTKCVRDGVSGDRGRLTVWAIAVIKTFAQHSKRKARKFKDGDTEEDAKDDIFFDECVVTACSDCICG